MTKPRGQVLLVEDNPVNRKVAEQMLERLGCAVECAEDGESGILAWRRKRFGMIFLDCQMPKLDGYAMTRKIREAEAHFNLSSTPIVALTAFAMEGEHAKCLEAGMDDYLPKPILLENLARVVSRYLDLDGSVPGSALQPSAAPYSEAGLDPEVLSALRALEAGRDPGLIDEMSEVFLSLTPERLRGIGEAFNRVDFRDLERLAHELKSSCGTLGVSRMARVCAEIETLAASQKSDGLGAHLSTLEREFAAARRSLEELRG